MPAPPVEPRAKNGLPRSMRSIPNAKSITILILVPILLTVWVYFGKHTAYPNLFKGLVLPVQQDVAATIYEYATAFILMFCIPAFVAGVAFKTPLRDFGLGTGDWRTGLLLLAVFTPLMLLAAFWGVRDPAMRAEYPLAKSAVEHLPLLLGLEAGYLVYYFSWEFLFRGFMQFGLEKPYGAMAAILIQTIPSTLVHIGKPFNECMAAIFAGILFGYVAWRSRSILFPMILHAVVGIGTDLIITFLYLR